MVVARFGLTERYARIELDIERDRDGRALRWRCEPDRRLPVHGGCSASVRIGAGGEFKTDIAGYLETYTRPRYPKTLQDLIDFNNANPRLEGPWNSAIFELAQDTGGRADPDCVAAREFATSTAQAAIEATLAANNLDAIIAPTNGPAWVTNSDPTKGDMDGDFSTFVGSSSPSAIAGWANITVPAGYAGPLPIGVSFIGGRWDEPTLIGLAYDFEQATHVRRPPTFIPSIGPDSAAREPASTGQSGPAAPGRNGSWRMLPLR